MPIVTGPLPFVSLFIAMAHMPIQVDLTNDESPHWTEQGATTPPAQPQTCAICLHDIHTETKGPDVPFEWPACRHVTHLQCAMQHVSHQARPSCPTCRQQWAQEGGHAMEAVRARHNVPWMVPETPRDTRTHQSEVPPAPDHLIPLCCPRLALIDHQHPEHDASWRELPVRHMDRAPTLNQTTQQWQPEWVCLRCTNTITPDHPAMRHTEPAPHCPTHGPRSLAIDLRQNERGWVCSRGYPPHILPCEPTQIPNAPAHVPQQQPNEPIQLDTGQWFRQGPPNQHQAIPHANSWFFVPLLLAGANRLQEQTEQQWRADPCAGHDWQTLVDALRTAPPIPWRDLHATIATLQQLARDSGHQLPAPELAILEQLATAGALEPAGAQVHLPWVMNTIAQPTGYLPATAQEALLQHFLGDRQASSAANLADCWRHPRAPSAPSACQPENPHPPDQPTRPTTTAAPPNQAASNDSSDTDTSEDTTSSTSTTSTSSTSTPPAATPPVQEAPPRTLPEQTSGDHQTHHHRYRAAFHSLDTIDLQETLMQKFIGFQKPPPHF